MNSTCGDATPQSGAAESTHARQPFDLETVRAHAVTGVASGYFQVLSLRGAVGDRRVINLVIAIVSLRWWYLALCARWRCFRRSTSRASRRRGKNISQRASIRPPRTAGAPDAVFALALLLGRPPEGYVRPAVAVSLTDVTVPRRVAARTSRESAYPPTRPCQRRGATCRRECQTLSAARAALIARIQLT